MIAPHPEFQLVGSAVTGDEALALTQKLLPDVLILDINMPGLKAIQVLQRIRELRLPTRVLILTSYSDASIVQAMMKAGATGYLLKDEGPSAILDAVQAVSKGRIWYSPSLREVVDQEDDQEAHGDFSPRETMILNMVAQGLSNKEICLQSGLAERTVEFYITRLFRKIRVNSRVELAIWAKNHFTFGI